MIHAGRLAAVQQWIQAHGIEALLIMRREDVRYLSGFSGSAGSLLIAQRTSVLITDFRYAVQSRSETSGIAVLIQKKDFSAALREAADQCGIASLCLDKSLTTIELASKIRTQGLRIVWSMNPVRDLRMRKARSELSCIRKAIRRAEDSFYELAPAIRPGITEQELALKLEYFMRARGSRRAAFDIIVASGRNGAMPHATASSRRIRNGEMITFDFGAEADGYYCDLTRTIVVGKATPKQRAIHELVLAAQAAAIAVIRPGIACADIDAAARGIIRDAGHAEHFGHGTGHGVGLQVHEGPTVSGPSKDTVESGMVFTVEPGVYVPGWGGIRIEDMVCVTNTGAKVLTSLPRGLSLEQYSIH